jgi:hypothetical protein
VTQNGGYYNSGTPDNWTATGFAAQSYQNAANGGFATGTPGNLTNIQPGLSGPNYQYVADDGQGTLTQDLGVPFLPNTRYTVDLAGGHRGGLDGNTTAFGLVSSTATITAAGPSAFLPGAVEGFINEGAMPVGTFNYASTLGANGGDFTFTTGAVAPAGDLVAYIYNNGAGRTEVSNFIVTATTVPEPSSLVLCGLAAIGLLTAVRRRKV